MKELVTLGTAIMFLTRLPVGRFSSGDMRVLATSVRYFPFVGLIIALIMSTALTVSAQFLPSSVAVAICLCVGILSTGAFHEDGLADVADSAGAFGIDRKLEIMRDSRVGTYGSLGLVVLMLLRFVVIWELLQVSLALTIGALVLAHCSGRWSSVYLMARVDYARAEAANRVVAEGVDNVSLMQATLCWFVVAIVPAMMISPWVFMSLAVVWIGTLLCAGYFRSAFTGITGDCLGAANVVIELLCLALVLGFVIR